MKKKTPVNKRIRKTDMAKAVLDFLEANPKRSFNYKQIAYGIGCTQAAVRNDILNLLDDLVAAEEIQEVALGKYKSPGNRGNVMEGIFSRRSNGRNWVVIDDEDIAVAERNSLHALNGDRVRVEISASRRGADPEARVVEILERKDQNFIGTVKVERNYAALVPDSKFLAADIVIPKNKLRGAHSGDKGIARITSWPQDQMNPIGEIVDVLGRKGENTAEMNAILAEFGLPYKYPESVEAAAEKIDAGITPEEVAKREDFRKVPTFTIDPRDAKDFDDALSIRTIGEGRWEVVCILPT